MSSFRLAAALVLLLGPVGLGCEDPGTRYRDRPPDYWPPRVPIAGPNAVTAGPLSAMLACHPGVEEITIRGRAVVQADRGGWAEARCASGDAEAMAAAYPTSDFSGFMSELPWKAVLVVEPAGHTCRFSGAGLPVHLFCEAPEGGFLELRWPGGY